MSTYAEKLEWILDNGLECKCCPSHKECDGTVKQTPDGPVLPACGEADFKDILDPQRVKYVYNELCVKKG